MSLSVYLVILLIVALWYAIIPIAGAFFFRYRWRRFRNRFNNMRQSTLLDYRQYRQLEEEGIYRFTGNIESITDGRTLWVRGHDLSMPVSIDKTKCYLLPVNKGGDIPDSPPEQIRWNRVSTLTEGSKVFIGGLIKTQDNRFNFTSTKEHPLVLIIYNCPDDDLAKTIIQTARTRNDYWNSITPISLVTGALTLVYIAASYLGRPAFRLTVITALAAIFIPILPLFPPGFALTSLYKRLSWKARELRSYWDLARYGLLPDAINKKSYALRAYSIEVLAWFLLIFGVCVNIAFIFLILFLFKIISF